MTDVLNLMTFGILTVTWWLHWRMADTKGKKRFTVGIGALSLGCLVFMAWRVYEAQIMAA